MNIKNTFYGVFYAVLETSCVQKCKILKQYMNNK
jgi:hypothetical protein